MAKLSHPAIGETHQDTTHRNAVCKDAVCLAVLCHRLVLALETYTSTNDLTETELSRTWYENSPADLHERQSTHWEHKGKPLHLERLQISR